MLIMWNFFDALAEGLAGLALMLDGIVYWLVGVLFDLYAELAGATIINSQTYQDIANRFMTIIGVVMLFYLTYSLLKALVNPDELNKSTNKVVMNIIVSLILISVIPTIFDYAFQFQNAIIEDHVIDNLLLGSKNSSVTQVGKETAMTVFDSFITDNGEPEINKNVSTTYVGWRSLKTCIVDNSTSGCVHDEGFRHVSLLAPSVVAGDIDYIFIISTICGCFLVYVIASFCLDMGVRVIKLAFYQIISPIPILMRIIPEKKSVFDNWLKAIIATYMEVFIRMFIMFIAIFFCSQINQGNISILGTSDVGLFAKVVILLGIFAFAKQAPKLLGDVIGVDSGNIKLGIGGKLAAGGALGLGAALGAGATTGLRNLAHGYGNIAKAVHTGKIGDVNKAVWQTAWSSIAGAGSGFVRGGVAGRSAKNMSDMRKAAGTGAKGATTARDEREAYRASHGGFFGSMAGHAMDTWKNAGDWLGGGFEADEAKIKWANEVLDQNSKLKAATESLRGKNSNNAQLLNGISVDWKGTSAQKGEYARLFSQFNGMSLSAIQDYINQQKNSKISREEFTTDGIFNQEGYDAALRDQARLNGNLDTMYKQLEGAVNQRLQTAAFDEDLADDIGITGDEKYSDIVNYVKQMNDSLKSNARDQINTSAENVGKAIKEAADKIEFERNNMAADVERKKRERAQRQGNNK